MDRAAISSTRLIGKIITPAQPMNDRRLSEARAHAIWRRAAALDDEVDPTPSTCPDPPQGTLAGEAEVSTVDYPVAHVRASAIEAGLSPRAVDRALHELGTRDSLESSADHQSERVSVEVALPQHSRRWLQLLLGAPVRIFAAARAPRPEAAPLSARLATLIERTLEIEGSIHETGGHFFWGSSSSDRRVQVHIAYRRDGVEIRAEERLHGTAGAIFASLLGGLGGGLFPVFASFSDPTVGILGWLATFSGILAAANAIYRAIATSRQSDLRELVTRLLDWLGSEPP